MQKCQNKVQSFASAHAQDNCEPLDSKAKELLPAAKSAYLYSVDHLEQTSSLQEAEDFAIIWGDVSILSRPCS